MSDSIRTAAICAVAMLLGACTADRVAGVRTPQDPAKDVFIGYSHVLNPGDDVGAWLQAINSDCSDSVDATISPGQFDLPAQVNNGAPGYGNLVVQDTCAGAPNTRRVFIHGAGARATTLVQVNTTPGPYPVPLDGFLVLDSNVYFADLAIQGNAQNPDPDVFGGAGIRFSGVAGGASAG